jgi:putative transposase
MPIEVQDVQQAYVFALDATPRQERQFASHVGGARYSYNWGLARIAEALDAYKAEKDAGVETPTTQIPNHFGLCKAWTAFKNDPANEVEWVGQNFVGTYQAALRDVAVAWKNFFKSRAGKRAGRRMGRPRFKSKHRSRRAFQVHGDTLQVVDSAHIKLPKIGVIKTHESTRKVLRRVIQGKARLVRGTVSQGSSGRWQISLTVEVKREIRTGPSARQRAGGAIGIDLGVRDIATTSDGTRWTNPRHLERAQRQLRTLNKALARTQKDSKRRSRARKRLGRAHARVANLRLDATHKMTSALIHAYAVIGVEGWDAQQVAQHGSKDVPKKLRRQRNRGLTDANVGNARWQLQSKAAWYGATVVVTAAQEPTGRTCSVCGQVRTKPVPIADELFHCPACDHKLDRRINTARVLAAVAQHETGAPSSGEPQNARGGNVRRGAPSARRALPGEAGSPRAVRKHGGQSGTPGP